MREAITTVALHREQDVVVCRQRAGQIAELLGLERQDQTRVATAVSEIARNAFTYAGSGVAGFAVERAEGETWLWVTVTDEGPGIAHLDRVLSGSYRSATGMGLGIAGSRRLMDRFDVDTAPGGGTRVAMAKRVPAPGASAATAAELAAELLRRHVPDPVEEVERQNKELLEALTDLRSRHEQVDRLNRELAETNRGIVALYAELEDRADELRQANEGRARFFSSVGHELRTPINSILALTRLMLTGDDELAVEPAQQAALILGAGQELATLVDDLLDLARARGEKLELHTAPVDIDELLSTLRGMLRPLATSADVELVVEEAEGLPVVHTDGAKVAQILRNLVTNALKFTERGEVRVRASADPAAATVRVTVADTGIGIGAADRERVFEEFAQVPGPLQTRARGSGLGLAVSRSLADILGASLVLDPAAEVGTAFTLTLPVASGDPLERGGPSVPEPTATRFTKALIVDDDPRFRYLLTRVLAPVVPSVIEAVSVAEGMRAVREEQPDLVFLDLFLPDGRGQELLAQLREDGHLQRATVFACTSVELDRAGRADLERDVAAVLEKDASLPDRVREELRAAGGRPPRRGPREQA